MQEVEEVNETPVEEEVEEEENNEMLEEEEEEEVEVGQVEAGEEEVEDWIPSPKEEDRMSQLLQLNQGM